ncbi:hypothetical protein [Syntrophomonas curvata]
MSTDNNNPNQYSVTFIDFLFTFAILIGLVPEGNGIRLKGIFSENWILHTHLPNVNELFTFLTFLICFLVVVLSWFGYHRAIEKYPHSKNSLLGIARFVIDVLLVLLYTLLLMEYKSLKSVLIITVIIFALYVIWDICLVFEYDFQSRVKAGSSFRNAYRAQFVTFIWFLLILILLCCQPILSKWIVVSLAIVFVVMHRVNKIYPIFKSFWS